MTFRAQEVLREALALPVDERADVAAELLASLDEGGGEDPAEVEAAWAAEIERRLAAVEKGQFSAQPWREAIEAIRQSLSQGPSS